MKSRSIIIDVKAENNAMGSIEYRKALKENIIRDLLSDVIQKPVFFEDFKVYTEEAVSFFELAIPEASSRLRENFASIHAMAILFDKSMRQDIQDVLLRYIKIQHEREAVSF